MIEQQTSEATGGRSGVNFQRSQVRPNYYSLCDIY